MAIPLGRRIWPRPVPLAPRRRTRAPVDASFTTTTSVAFAVERIQCSPRGPCQTAGESMLSRVSRVVIQLSLSAATLSAPVAGALATGDSVPPWHATT